MTRIILALELVQTAFVLGVVAYSVALVRRLKRVARPGERA